MSVSPTPIKRFTGAAAKKNFFGVVREKVTEAIEKAHDVTKRPTSAAKWTDFAQRPPTGREIRRAQSREIDRQTKKFRKQQARSVREVSRHNELQAVKVLRHFEEQWGRGQGDLRAQLLEDGALELKPWPKGHHSTGHSAQEILSAAGLTPEKIQELNEEIAAQQAVSA